MDRTFFLIHTIKALINLIKAEAEADQTGGLYADGGARAIGNGLRRALSDFFPDKLD